MLGSRKDRSRSTRAARRPPPGPPMHPPPLHTRSDRQPINATRSTCTHSLFRSLRPVRRASCVTVDGAVHVGQIRVEPSRIDSTRWCDELGELVTRVDRPPPVAPPAHCTPTATRTRAQCLASYETNSPCCTHHRYHGCDDEQAPSRRRDEADAAAASTSSCTRCESLCATAPRQLPRDDPLLCHRP